MTTTVSTAMKENNHRALKWAAVSLSLIVYLAGLLYAGVRSYTLFSATIESWLLPLALIGIVALELTAIALPLAIHFWTQPGPQRLAAMGFYLLDLTLIAGNAVLDAAKHSGAEVSGLLTNYGVYVVPALPLMCMAGWSLIWLLDPTSRERDMRESVKAATHEALLSQIQKAVEQADVTQAVEDAANEAARALVAETLGNVPRRPQGARAISQPLATVYHNAEAEPVPELAERAAMKARQTRNHRAAPEPSDADPK